MLNWCRVSASSVLLVGLLTRAACAQHVDLEIIRIQPVVGETIEGGIFDGDPFTVEWREGDGLSEIAVDVYVRATVVGSSEPLIALSGWLMSDDFDDKVCRGTLLEFERDGVAYQPGVTDGPTGVGGNLPPYDGDPPCDDCCRPESTFSCCLEPFNFVETPGGEIVTKFRWSSTERASRSYTLSTFTGLGTLADGAGYQAVPVNEDSLTFNVDYVVPPTCPPLAAAGAMVVQSYTIAGGIDSGSQWSWRIDARDRSFSGFGDNRTPAFPGLLPCGFFEPIVCDYSGDEFICYGALRAACEFARAINFESRLRGCDQDFTPEVLEFGVGRASILATAMPDPTYTGPLLGGQAILSITSGAPIKLSVGDAGSTADRVVLPGQTVDFNPSIEETPFSGVDCNANIRDDQLDVLIGTSLDDNGNGIPDECDCSSVDRDGDGSVAIVDLLAFLSLWFDGGSGADTDGDGVVTVVDLLGYLSLWFFCS